MMGRKSLVALVVLVMLAIGAVDPPRAQAVDVEKTLIISGATAGALVLITFIAILASSDDDEPDFLSEMPRRRAAENRGMRFGFRATRSCPTVGGNISLACW
jgi:hypothetical protein